MNTIERLRSFHAFSSDILASIERAAEIQNGLTNHELADRYHLDDIYKVDTPEGAKKPVEIIDYIPRGGDTETANIGFTAFGVSLNECAVWRSMRLVESAPDKRWIFVGNSSSPLKDVGRLTVPESIGVILTGDLRPTVEPALRYAVSEGLTEPSFFGFSAGGIKTQAAAIHADRYGLKVDKSVMVDPSTVVSRGLLRLAKDFWATKAEMPNYVDRTQCDPYVTLSNAEDKMGFARYLMGFGRMSNIAMISKLKQGDFGVDLDIMMRKQPDMVATVGWGTHSELATDAAMYNVVLNAMNKFGQGRVHEMRLTGMHHAGMEDIDLYAAIMLQGLSAGKDAKAGSNPEYTQAA